MRAAAFLMLATASMGCVVDADGSAEGKPCPCPADLHCDALTHTCRSSSACDPLVTLSDDGLEPVWKTPHTIRWRWHPLGDASDFDHYRLVVGSSRDEVESNAEGVRVFDSSVNPELGTFLPPGSDGEVATTVTDGLTPQDASNADVGRTFARLEIVDRSSCVFVSDVVESETAREDGAACGHSVFPSAASEETSPASLVEVESCNGHTQCLSCSDESGCSSEAGWSIILQHAESLSGASPNEIENGRAFLRLSVAVGASEPGDLASLGVAVDTGGGCEAEPRFTFDEMFLRAGQLGWQDLEIPFSHLIDRTTGQPVDPDLLQGLSMCALHIAAGPGAAGDVLLDDIAGCWGP